MLKKSEDKALVVGKQTETIFQKPLLERLKYHDEDFFLIDNKSAIEKNEPPVKEAEPIIQPIAAEKRRKKPKRKQR